MSTSCDLIVRYHSHDPSLPDASTARDSGEPVSRPVTDAQSLVLRHDIAAHEGNFVVAWSGYLPSASEQSLNVTTLSAAGEPLQTKALHTLDMSLEYLQLLAAPEGLAVFYRHESDDQLYFETLTASGGGTWRQRVVGTYAHDLHVFPLGDGYGLATLFSFQCGSNPKPTTVTHLQRLDTDGALTGSPVPMPCGPSWQDAPVAVQTEAGVVAAWAQGSQVVVVALDDTFAVVGEPTTIKGQTTARSAHVAALEGSLLVSWRTGPDQFHQNQLNLLAVGADVATQWHAPVKIVVPNVEASLDSVLAAGPRSAIFLWEADWATALPQVDYLQLTADPQGRVEPPALESAMLTEPLHLYAVPRVARGADRFGVIVKGIVDGTRGTFFYAVQP